VLKWGGGVAYDLEWGQSGRGLSRGWTTLGVTAATRRLPRPSQLDVHPIRSTRVQAWHCTLWKQPSKKLCAFGRVTILATAGTPERDAHTDS